MAERLLSVGLDVGTTTTQLIVSEITVENRASGFCVPQMDITGRKILYESPVIFTPLVGQELVDGQAIARWVQEQYRLAGITARQVDSGAVIVTGETSRKENAAAVLQAMAQLAGQFVVATAGPDLESVLAAKGAGAVELSEKTGKPVLHMDIGGGTANLAWILEGQVVRTGCLNVGGRLVKVENGKIAYVSPVVRQLRGRMEVDKGADEGCSPLQGRMEVGEAADPGKLEALADILVQALEMAAGRREVTPLLDALWTRECRNDDPSAMPLQGVWKSGDWVISFSGGVADCIGREYADFAFGDMGPILGKTIRKSRLCQGQFLLGQQTIRATVIGAGCHSAQLSGSTVFHQNVTLPLQNLPVVALSEQEQLQPQVIARRLAQSDAPAVLAMPGFPGATYAQVGQLAQTIAQAVGDGPVYVCLEQDMAKALGQRLCLALGAHRPCLCIDRVRLEQGSFLDVGKPVGPSLPVVVKTLILNG